MTLQEKQSEFIEMFNSLESWPDRFQFLIDMGSGLDGLPEVMKCTLTQIISCNSRTFFYPSVFDGIVHIRGWSNSAIMSGLIAMLQMIFNGCQVDEIWEAKVLNTIDFHLRTNLINNLTEQRKAGLLEMINRVIRL